jgi:hypothetical protein
MHPFYLIGSERGTAERSFSLGFRAPVASCPFLRPEDIISDMISSSLLFPASSHLACNRIAGHSFHVYGFCHIVRARKADADYTACVRMCWLSTDEGGLKVVEKAWQSH